MAGRRPLSLDRRQGVYYFRASIPLDLQAMLGRREVRLSLRTRRMAVAHLKTFRGRLAFAALCARLRSMASTPSPEQIRAIIRTFGLKLLAEAEIPPVFGGPDQNNDRDFALHLAAEAITDLNLATEPEKPENAPPERLAAGENMIRPVVQKLAAAHGIDLAILPEGERLMLSQGVGRALIEQHHKFILRASDFITPYEPAFALLKDDGTEAKSVAFVAAVEAYIATKAAGWTPRTKDEIKRILRLATEHFGAATPLPSISKDAVRAFRDSILHWRKKPPPNISLADLATTSPEKRIGARTAKKYMGFVTGAFAFWVDEGYIDANPVGKITVKVSKSDKKGTRRPFSAAELETRGCQVCQVEAILGSILYPI